MTTFEQGRYLDYPDTWSKDSIARYETLYMAGIVNQDDIWAIEDRLVWFRNARDEMAYMRQLQSAFEEMKFQLLQYTDGWIITVYPDGSEYIDGAHWSVVGGAPPTMYMSDDLYAMYCESVGMENTNQR